MNHTIINKLKRLSILYYSYVVLIVGMLMLLANVMHRQYYIGRPYQINEHAINEKIDFCFSQTYSICKQWLNSSDDSVFIEKLWRVGVPQQWEQRRVSMLLFKGDSLVFWSNYYYAHDINLHRFQGKRSVVKCGSHKLIFKKYIDGEKTALVLLNLSSDDVGINRSIFPQDHLTVYSAEEINTKDNYTIIDNEIYLKAQIQTTTPLSVRIMGWLGLFLIAMSIKRFFRKRTDIKNVFLMSFLFMVTLLLFAMFFFYYSIQHSNQDSFSADIITTDGKSFTIAGVLIIFSMMLLYAIYIYNVRNKLKYKCSKINNKIIRGLIILLAIILINTLVAFFHYSMVNIIYNSNINIELYKLTALNFSSIVFYVIGGFFVTSRILLNAAVRTIFPDMKLVIVIPMSLVVLTLILLPIESSIRNTGYIVVLFQVAYLLLSSVDKYPKRSDFSIIISIFSLYVLLFSTIESRNADNISGQNYAREIAANEKHFNYLQNDPYPKFTYYIIDRHSFDVKEDNSFELQNLRDILRHKTDTIVNEYNYVHIIHHTPIGKIVLVSRPQISILDYAAYFAYIFITMFIICGSILSYMGMKVKKTVRSKFASKIKFVITGTILFTMIMAVSVLTINTFDSYNLTRKQLMNNQMRSIMNSLNNFTYKYHGSKEDFLQNWFTTSDGIIGKNLNIFDVQGNLILTSLPFSVSTHKMNSHALSEFKEVEVPIYNTQYIYRNITYNSSFIPAYLNGERLGYINLIQRDRLNNIATDARYGIIVNLLNLLMVVVLLSMLISMFIYRGLVKPLNKLYDGMSNIAALKKIEQNSKGDDEISTLISQYNKMIDYLNESYTALARAEREGAWRNMARQVAHEIKNPLTPMRLKVQMLQRARQKNSPNIEQQTDATLELLIDQIDILTKIANEFSDFAKIEQTKAELVSVAALLRNIGELYGSNEQVKFVVRCTDEDMMINVDYAQVNRVFVNLCQNALQAIGDAGRRGLIEISAVRDGNRVVFTVKDNGSGISEEVSKRMFEPNFTTKTTGSGLGLAMSREIILNSGGVIRFSSTPGVGTVFTVILPLAHE